MKTKMKLSLIALTVAAVIGCAQTRTAETPQRAPETASITQIGYGPNARFVTCPLAGCLKPTPKTMREPPGAEPEPAPRTGTAVPIAPTTLMAAAAPVMVVSPVAPTPAATPAPAPAPPPAASAVEPVAVPPKVDDKHQPPKTGLSSHNNVAPESAPRKGMRQRVFINFPAGSARLSAEAKRELDRVVPYVQEAQKVVIKGRTDERGDNDSNDRLALRRAMAVYDHLKRAAKAGDKPFKLLAKGACCYIARNDTEEGRAENRRAEIDFVVPLQASVSPTRRATSKAHSS